jgi:hypothetical protein
VIQATSAVRDYSERRLLGSLGEHVCNDDCIPIQAVDDAPDFARVDDSKFMAPVSDYRHRPRVWHTQHFTALKQA